MLLALLGMFKDEAKTIRKVLEAARPHVDRYCIIDTGSTDGTQDIIREVMAGLPGELLEEPFAGYMETRNRLLDLDAKALAPAQYQLMLSGDEVLLDGEKLRTYLEAHGKEADCHMLRVLLDGEVMVPRPVITRTGSDFRYDDFDCGVHEIVANHVNPKAPVALCYDAGIVHDTADIERKMDSVRYDHVPKLVAALERNPNNTRALEFLAKSYGYLMNMEPDEDDQRAFARQCVEAFQLRLALPFEMVQERHFMTTRFLDAALHAGDIAAGKLYELADKLCEEDQEHAEPLLIRLLIAMKLEGGITAGRVYKLADATIKRAEAIRARGIKDSAPRNMTVEWQAHRLAATAAMNLGREHPEMIGVSQDHIAIGINLGGPWIAFAGIADEIKMMTEKAGAPAETTA